MIGTARQRRIGITFLDQTVSSLSNFGTGVVVARIAGPAEFGGYMIAFMVWVVVVGIHRAVITEPLIVGTQESDHRWLPMAEGASADIMLGLAVSILVATVSGIGLALGEPLAEPLLALSPWFAALLVQDYWRAVAFQRRQPGTALLNDLLFLGVQVVAIAAFLAMGFRSAEWVIAAWGIGATAGALIGFKWFPGSISLREGGRLMRRLWPTSRWMLADFATGFTSDQAYLVFAAILLTSSDYGGLRAAFSLMGPTVVILLTGGNIGLPEATRHAATGDPARLRAFTRHLTLATLSCVALYGGLVSLTGERLLNTLYGRDFAPFGLLVSLSAVRYVILVTVFGHLIALKAVGRMRRLWQARMGVGLVSLASMVVLVRWLGPAGAGWSGVASAVCYAGAIFVIYRIEMAPEVMQAHQAVPEKLPGAARPHDSAEEDRGAEGGHLSDPYNVL